MAGTARALIFCVALGFGIAALPASASAQNASVAGTLEAYPTFNSIGVRLPFTGDADGDAVAHVEWRLRGESGWRRGVDLTRITNNRWAGSVLWLPADTLVELEAIIGDPDGSSVASGSARTRREPQTTTPGTVRWVATDGSDGNPGTSSAPLATLQAAADRADPGDEIRVRPGVYHQWLHVTRAGTAAARIRVVADGPGVVLDGSDPALLHSSAWTSVGGGVYAIAYTGTTRLVCADSLQRLYRQASLADLQANANGVAQGWTVADGRLYVKLEDGSSPTGHTMHVARYDIGVFLEASHWRVGGLEVRYFGTTAAAAGINLRAADDCWIQGNHVHTCAGRGIWVRVGAADNLVEDNLVRDPRVGTWPWSACKGHEEEIPGISIRGGRGNVIRANTVAGTFDGIDACNGSADENVTADTDCHGNTVTGCGDDAIETDTVSGINLRIWDNTLDGNFVGFSLAPIYQGPEYVLYNTVTDYTRSAFKFSLSGAGHAWICHNTTYSSVPHTSAVWPSGPYSNMHFRDNILAGNDAAPVKDDSGESLTGNDFDGDLLYVTGSSTLFRWKGTDYTTLAALRAATGFEKHGTAGDPLFVSPAAGDFRLQSASPAAGAAVFVLGVDDCPTATTPDIGTGEHCGSSGVTAVDSPPALEAGTGLALAGARPNPARGDLVVAFTLPDAGGGRLEVVDVAGRRVLARSLAGFAAGNHLLRLDTGERLAPGIYLLRLSQGGRAVTSRVCVIR
jgi:hypothetical protein